MGFGFVDGFDVHDFGHFDHGFLDVTPYFGGHGHITTYPYGGYLGDQVYVADNPVVIYQDSQYARPRPTQRSGNYRNARSSLELGRRLFKDRDYQRAADTFLDAVLADPTAGYPKLLFGHALFAVGDYDYASYAIRRAIDRIDDLDAASPSVDELYGSADRFDRLVYKLHDHVRRHALDEDANFLLGYFRYFAGDYQGALRSLDRALLLNAIDRQAKVLRRLVQEKLAESPQSDKAEPASSEPSQSDSKNP